MLLSNVSSWPRVGHLCLIGHIGLVFLERRTSERMRAIRVVDRQAVFTPCPHVMFYVTFVAAAPLFCVLCALVGAVMFWACFSEECCRLLF